MERTKKVEEVEVYEPTEEVIIPKKKPSIPVLLHKELTDLYFEKQIMKAGRFKEDREYRLNNLLAQAKNFSGLKPLKTMTLSKNGVVYKLVDGVPTPKEFTDLFTDKKQLNQYFKG